MIYFNELSHDNRLFLVSVAINKKQVGRFAVALSSEKNRFPLVFRSLTAMAAFRITHYKNSYFQTCLSTTKPMSPLVDAVAGGDLLVVELFLLGQLIITLEDIISIWYCVKIKV